MFPSAAMNPTATPKNKGMAFFFFISSSNRHFVFFLSDQSSPHLTDSVTAHRGSLAISLTPAGLLLPIEEAPRRWSYKEVTNMGIMEELLNEKGKEAVMDDDSEPSDIADQAYKEWLEERYLRDWKDGQHR